MPPTIDPTKLPIPPIATAMKPEIVKNCPLSNCSDMIGATMMPPIDPIIAASPKLSRIIARRSIPISRAAAGFSAQARSARPSLVLLQQQPQSDDDDGRVRGEPNALRWDT